MGQSGSKSAHFKLMEVSGERAMLENRRGARYPAHPPCTRGLGIRKVLDANRIARRCCHGDNRSASSLPRVPAQRGYLLAEAAERP